MNYHSGPKLSPIDLSLLNKTEINCEVNSNDVSPLSITKKSKSD